MFKLFCILVASLFGLVNLIEPHPFNCGKIKQVIIWKQASYSCLMKLPVGYRFFTVSGGELEEEHEFLYPDSAVVYITDFAGGSFLNYANIQALGKEISSKRFSSSLPGLDTASSKPLVLNGVTKTSRYWKDIKIGELSIGYANVPESRKRCFDQALNSFVQKKNGGVLGSRRRI